MTDQGKIVAPEELRQWKERAEDTEETLRLTREEFARHMVEWNVFKERAEQAEARLSKRRNAMTLPRLLHVSVEDNGGDPCLIACPGGIDECVPDDGRDHVIGLYKLIVKRKVVKVTKVLRDVKVR